MQTGKTLARNVLLAGSVLLLAAPVAAMADDSGNTWGIQLGYGHANHHSDKVDKADLGLVWDPHLTFWQIGNWNFRITGEAHAVYWHTNGNVDATIGEFGLSPMLRFERSVGAIRPYIEAGSGIRVLTHPRVSSSYTLSSAFQFADTVGVGAAFGSHQQYQIGYRFQHISNASIKRPNPGIDFNSVYVQYNF